jgi:hypothetical protein
MIGPIGGGSFEKHLVGPFGMRRPILPDATVLSTRQIAMGFPGRRIFFRLVALSGRYRTNVMWRQFV